MKKVMIVLGVLVFACLSGCRKSEKENGLVGTYVNKDDSNEYFVLEENGIYRYCHKKLGYDLTGKWEIKGNQIIVDLGTGPMPPRKIKGNKIIDDSDGSVYIKAGKRSSTFPQKSSPEKKISKNTSRISGEYTIEEIKKDGTTKKVPGITIFREDGKIVLRAPDSREFVIPDQRWEFKNGAVQIYQGENNEDPLIGKVEGETIIFKLDDGGLRYKKQD